MAISPETARVEALYQNMFRASDGSIESLRAGYIAMFAGFKVPTDAVTDHFEAYGYDASPEARGTCRLTAPDAVVLEAILVALASALRMLSDVMVCLPLGFDRAVTLENALGNIRALADDICAECVPQVYAPSLTTWMDRIQETARKIV